MSLWWLPWGNGKQAVTANKEIAAKMGVTSCCLRHNSKGPDFYEASVGRKFR